MPLPNPTGFTKLVAAWEPDDSVRDKRQGLYEAHNEDRSTQLGLALPIPADSLHEVLRRWNGRGRLYDALAAVDDGHPWDRRRQHVERRACRMLFQKLVPCLDGWPTHIDDWLDALPAQSLRERVADAPRRGVSWRESRRHGWPPRRFVGRTRTRVASQELACALRWTLEELLRIWKLAVKGGTEVDTEVRDRLKMAEHVLALPILQALDAIPPGMKTRRTMRSEGGPWVGVAAVADALRDLDEQALHELAQELIEPDPELRWRLFHLGVLGTLLRALGARGAKVVSLRPLADSSRGPAYAVEVFGRRWDLWFEAAGLWKAYGLSSPYQQAMAGLLKTLRSRGPDLALVCRNELALVLECKYSSNLDYVCQAYEQVTAYANELRTGVVERVVGLTIVPEGVVTKLSSTDTALGRLGVGPPSELGAVLDLLESPP